MDKLTGYKYAAPSYVYAPYVPLYVASSLLWGVTIGKVALGQLVVMSGEMCGEVIIT